MTVTPQQHADAEVEGEVQKTSTERLIFFSDAVIAIAITLLALELPLPVGEKTADAWASFGGHLDVYLAFLISFAVIGTQWLNHHNVFRYVIRMTRRLGRLNLLWLLVVVVTPFATHVLVGEVPFTVGFTIYSGVQAVGALTMLFIIILIRRNNLTRPGTPDAFYREATWRMLAFVIAFLVAIPVAYQTHWAYAIWGVLPPVFGAFRRRLAARRGVAAR